jgi:NAD(P)-dependent dehydrogenase (short-subunit alcohol dehydrogenase family)
MGMTKQLEDRVALVTGGARGIGAATALRLAEEGVHLCVCDVNLDSVQETIDAIHALGREAMALKCDVANSDEVEAMIEKTVGQFGRLDILINNAGVLSSALELHNATWYLSNLERLLISHPDQQLAIVDKQTMLQPRPVYKVLLGLWLLNSDHSILT